MKKNKVIFGFIVFVLVLFLSITYAGSSAKISAKLGSKTISIASGKFLNKTDEASLTVCDNCIITGIGAGTIKDNSKNSPKTYVLDLIIYESKLNSDGSLGKANKIVYKNKSNIQRTIVLPENYVAVGWGGRISNGKVIDLEVYAKKLNSDGSLGREEVFKNKTTNKSPESYAKLSNKYLLTAIGGRAGKHILNKVNISGKEFLVNHKPVLESISYEGNLTEGNLIKIKTKTTDSDGDKVTLKYSSPFNSNGEWQTKEGDAGTYIINITLNDGTDKVVYTSNFTLNKKPNIPPVLNVSPKSQEILEGELAKVYVSTTDADNDSVTITFSDKFNNKGEWQTKEGDAGTYKIIVTASDNKNKVSETITVIVLKKQTPVTNNTNETNQTDYTDGNYTNRTTNNPPMINSITYSGEYEEDLFIIKVNATDEDNDLLNISYESPFDSNGEWQTKEGDAGTYKIIVTASDGKNITSKETIIIVKEKQTNNGDGNDGDGKDEKNTDKTEGRKTTRNLLIKNEALTSINDPLEFENYGDVAIRLGEKRLNNNGAELTDKKQNTGPQLFLILIMILDIILIVAVIIYSVK